MNFFKNLFKSKTSKAPIVKAETKQAKAPDVLFVENFIAKKGKFLYCQTLSDVKNNLIKIFNQEQWQKVFTYSNKLNKLLKSINVDGVDCLKNSDCYFSKCEQLIAEDGSILFSSKQLKENKLVDLPNKFVVFAKTSQLVNNKGESLASIKNRYQKKRLPNNISAIKNYNLNEKSTDFMSYGNNNTKQLFLILLEDL